MRAIKCKLLSNNCQRSNSNKKLKQIAVVVTHDWSEIYIAGVERVNCLLEVINLHITLVNVLSDFDLRQ